MRKAAWALVAACLTLAGCGPRIVDVSDEYKDRGVFGRRFETKIVFLITEADHDFQLERPDSSNAPKLVDVRNTQLPYDYYGTMIHGIVEARAVIEIVGALRSTSSTMGTDYFKVRILTGPFQGKEIGARFLKPFGTNEIFDPKYAVEVTTATKTK